MDETKQDRGYKILPFGEPRSIRELVINDQKNRTSGRVRIFRQGQTQNGIQPIKDKYIKTFLSIYYSNKLDWSLIIVQSIKPKGNIILHFLLHNEIDLTLITKTWLPKGDDDPEWVNSSTLNMGEYRIQVINRPDRREGLALIAKAKLKTKLLDSGPNRYLEFGVWEVKFKNALTTVSGISPTALSTQSSNQLHVHR